MARVALTAVGLLARSIGVDKLIPRAQVQPVPVISEPAALLHHVCPPTVAGQVTVQFQVEGTEFAADGLW